MGTSTIRVPDATHARLKQLAKAKSVSVNKLIEKLSAAALTQFDAETRFMDPRCPRQAQGRTCAARQAGPARKARAACPERALR